MCDRFDYFSSSGNTVAKNLRTAEQTIEDQSISSLYGKKRLLRDLPMTGTVRGLPELETGESERIRFDLFVLVSGCLRLAIISFGSQLCEGLV